MVRNRRTLLAGATCVSLVLSVACGDDDDGGGQCGERAAGVTCVSAEGECTFQICVDGRWVCPEGTDPEALTAASCEGTGGAGGTAGDAAGAGGIAGTAGDAAGAGGTAGTADDSGGVGGGPVGNGGAATACTDHGGQLFESWCCKDQGGEDFPNTCGPDCACAPTEDVSDLVWMCDCGEGRCWNGSACIDQ
jgi:hypothetical protein